MVDEIEIVAKIVDKNEEKKRLGCALYCTGMGLVEIARRIDVDRKTLSRWATKMKWEFKRQEWMALRDNTFCAQAGLPAEQALATIHNTRVLTQMLTEEIEACRRNGHLAKVRELITCMNQTHNLSMQAYRDMGIDIRLKLKIPENL